MELSLQNKDGCTIARTHGALDESARTSFREKLHPLVGTKGGRVIIDLEGSARVNSAGIGNLVALTADANTNNSRVVLCNVQPYVATVISVTKLDRYFTIATDVPEAIARANEGRTE